MQDDFAAPSRAGTLADSIHSSPRMVAQRRQLEGLFGAPVDGGRSADHVPDSVAQRKALSAGKLNVAGEEHGESGSRRASEKQYAREKGANDYWQEGDFTYKPPDTRPELFRRSWLPGGPKETHGDPFMLRAEHLLAMLDEKHGGVLLAQFARGEVPSEFGTGMTIDQAWNFYCENSLFHAVREPIEAIDKALQSEGEKDKATGFITHYRMLAEIAGTITSTYRLTGTEPIKMAATRLIREIRTVRSEFSRKSGFTANRSEDVISGARSDAMLTAAGQSGKRGLWKVGDSHIADFRTKGAPDETGAYRLMSRAEFNEDYEMWDAENEKLLIADYVKVKDSRDGARILAWYQAMANPDSKHSKASRERVLGRSHVERMWIDLDEENKKSVLTALNSSDKLAAMSGIIWMMRLD